MVGFFRNIRRYGVRSDQTVAEASIREVNFSEDDSLFKQEVKHHQEQLNQVKRLIEEIDRSVIPLLSDPQKEDFQEAMIYGSTIASFTIEGFGIENLLNVEKEKINYRFNKIKSKVNLEKK